MNITELVAVAVLVWVLVRQFQPRRLAERGTFVVPAVLALLGGLALLRLAQHGGGIGSAAVIWIVVDVIAGVLTGIVRATTVRLFERDGVLWRQGTRLTLALWIASVAIRVAVAAIGSHHGAGPALDRSLPLSFGISLAAQYLVIGYRAERRSRRPGGVAATGGETPIPAGSAVKPAGAVDPAVTDGASTPVASSRMGAGGPIVAIGSWASRHRGLVIGLWLVLVVGATIGHRALGGNYSDTLTIPNSSAQQGLNLLRAHDSSSGGQGGQVVFVATEGTIESHAAAITQTVSDLERQADVLRVSDPLQTSAISSNGRIAYATVNFSANPQGLGKSYVNSFENATAPARQAGLQVSYGGAIGQAVKPKAKDSRSELIGIVVALVVLLVGFGSVIAAGLPLLSAILGVISAIGLLGMLASAIMFGTSSPTLATMMGLGVGIDYGLFLTTRYRQRLIDGAPPEPALRDTLATSGRAVLVAAVTVVIAMLSLYASGISYIGTLGLAAAIAVAVAATSALTLIPALLTLAGPRIDRYVARRAIAEPPATHGRLHNYVGALSRHPWRYALSGIALLFVVAIPALSMNLGHVGPGQEPTSFTERQAYDAISAGFGAGANGPLTIVLDTADHEQDTQVASRLQAALQSTPDVASVTPFKASTNGAVMVARVIPTTGPDQPATQTLVDRLQDQTLPAQLRGTGITGYVSGTTAAQLDFQRTVSSHLPIIIAVVIAAAFLLLLIAFRSPVLAAKAALLNLLSIGAAWGVLVAVFQWGWGATALGLPGKVPIESYVPMIIFAIVFGLSMDYEVFLLSRVREHWHRTHDNRSSVAAGLNETARVISCAAIIMASVFLAFLLSTNVVVKMFALGLGVSVIVDATVIRLLIVPALMFVFGTANWWTPRWLDRLLPGGQPRTGSPASGGLPAGADLDRPAARAGRRLRPAHLVAAILGASVLAAFGITFAATSSAGSQATTKAKRLDGIAATVGATTVKTASLSSPLTLAGTVGAADGTAEIMPQATGTITSLSISVGQQVSAGQAVAQLTDGQDVTAPVAGTIAQIMVPVGGYASPTTPIATLVGANETLTAQASPSEVMTLQGHVGASATASLAALGSHGVSATLTQIAPSADASTQQTAVTFTTKAALQPGAPVTVSVHLASPRGPVVPSDAIVESGGRQGIYLLSNIVTPAEMGITLPAGTPAGVEVGRATFAPVRTGISENGRTQILSGVSAGAKIVSTGQTNLTSVAKPQRVAILPTGTSKSASSSTSSTQHGATSTTGGIDVTVVSVHGSKLTVTTPIGQRTLTVPAGFRITRDGTPVALTQLHRGQVLKVAFTRVNGKLTPTSATLQ